MSSENENIQLVVIDFLCGAGGVSSGFEQAEIRRQRIAKVIAGLNHDEVAVDSHLSNFLHVEHFIEDVRKVDINDLIRIIAQYKIIYPNAKLVLWFSLECTNFSRAKGGLPRNADSRMLAHQVFRFMKLNPDYIMIENVEEFMSWGPLDINGKPISKRNGSDYVKWCNEVQTYGYRFEHAMLNAADFGAYTSRKRYFGIFAQHGLPIAWPVPTHAKNPQKEGMFGKLEKWKAVREVLDLDDHGKSIFGRKKDLSEKTYARIYAGLVKYIAGGKDAFLLKYNSINKETGKHVPPGIDEPCPTIAAQSRLGVVQPQFISKYFSGKPEGKNITLNGPAGTIKTIDSQALISTNFIAAYYGNGDNVHSTEGPAPTIRTKDGAALISAQFIDKQFSGDANHQSVDQPAGSILINDKHALVSAEKFIMNPQFNNVGSSLDQPLPTITANRKWHYLINPSWYGNNGSIDAPCCTVVARQDKAPLYLVTTEEGFLAIEVFATDSEYIKKIKEFMGLYGIIDIKMRMLKVNELLKIQGFPEGYILKGTQADQKKFIGNSVVPLVVKKIAEAISEKLIAEEKHVAA